MRWWRPPAVLIATGLVLAGQARAQDPALRPPTGLVAELVEAVDCLADRYVAFAFRNDGAAPLWLEEPADVVGGAGRVPWEGGPVVVGLRFDPAASEPEEVVVDDRVVCRPGDGRCRARRRQVALAPGARLVRVLPLPDGLVDRGAWFVGEVEVLAGAGDGSGEVVRLPLRGAFPATAGAPCRRVPAIPLAAPEPIPRVEDTGGRVGGSPPVPFCGYGAGWTSSAVHVEQPTPAPAEVQAGATLVVLGGQTCRDGGHLLLELVRGPSPRGQDAFEVAEARRGLHPWFRGACRVTVQAGRRRLVATEGRRAAPRHWRPLLDVGPGDPPSWRGETRLAVPLPDGLPTRGEIEVGIELEVDVDFGNVEHVEVPFAVEARLRAEDVGAGCVRWVVEAPTGTSRRGRAR